MVLTRYLGVCICFVALLTGSMALPASAGILVNNGVASGNIVVKNEAGNEKVLTAAQDLSTYINRMSGATVPVRWDYLMPGPFRVLVGSTLFYTVNPNDVTEEKVGHDGFIIKTVPTGVVVAGRTMQGTANGVYYLAEKVLGVHWFSVEDDFPTCPQQSTVEIPTMNITVKPDFAFRSQYYSFQQSPGYQPSTNPLHLKLSQNRDVWWAFNRMTGISAEVGHAYEAIVPRSLFSTHPEYFPYIDYTFSPGTNTMIQADQNCNLPYWPHKCGRYAPNDTFQRCFGNSDVLQMTIDYTHQHFADDPTLRYATLSEADGPWWCEDALCKALGPTPSHRIIAFCNAVATANHADYPDRGYVTLAYHRTLDPPTGTVAHPSIVPGIAPLWQCRLHPISSECPESAYLRSVIEGWDVIADKLTYYNYTTPAPFTFPGPLALAEEMRFHRDHNSIGGLRENQFLPAVNWQMLNWMETQLWWDADQDPVQLRRTFIEGYYGTAAADAIERVYEGLEAGIREGAGSGTWPADPGDGLHGLSGSEVLRPHMIRLQGDLQTALTAAQSQSDPFRYRINRDMGALLYSAYPEFYEPFAYSAGSTAGPVGNWTTRSGYNGYNVVSPGAAYTDGDGYRLIANGNSAYAQVQNGVYNSIERPLSQGVADLFATNGTFYMTVLIKEQGSIQLVADAGTANERSVTIRTDVVTTDQYNLKVDAVSPGNTASGTSGTYWNGTQYGLYAVRIVNRDGNDEITVIHNPKFLTPGWDTPSSHRVQITTVDITASNYSLIRIDGWGGNGWAPSEFVGGVDEIRIARSWGMAAPIALPGPVSGRVELMDHIGDRGDVSIKIQFRQGGSTVRTVKVFPDSEGRFVVDSVDAGTYDIAITGPTWLQKVLPNVPVSGATNVGTISLTGGDLNGDNSVTHQDVGLVLPNMDQTGDQ